MNNSAHAWVEAYIDGIGWMTFEPTAANPNAEMLAWGKKYKGEETAEVEVDDQLEEWLSEVEAQGSSDNQNSSLAERLSGEKKGEEIVDMGIIKRILIYVGIILLAVVTFSAFNHWSEKTLVQSAYSRKETDRNG